MKKELFLSMIIFASGVLFQSCDRTDGAKQSSNKNDSPPQILNGGSEIVFNQSTSELHELKIDTVREENVQFDFLAPAHLAVSVVSSEFETNNVFLFENQNLTQLYSAMVKAKSEVERTSKNLIRLRDLFSSKAVSDKDLLDAQTSYSQAQAEFAQDESQMRASGIDPRDLAKTPAGTVLAIADVPENQVSNFRTGTRAELQCNAYPTEKFIGSVSAIGDVVDPATRTVKIRIATPNSQNKLRAGMYCSVRILGVRRNLITIPTTAVVREGDGTMTAWVTTDRHRFQKKVVTLGTQKDNRYQIASGLRPGDLIVSEGAIFLSNMQNAQAED